MIITWISNPSEFDVFQTLFNIKYNEINTPLLIDKLLIKQYFTEPYHGSIKHTVDVMGGADWFIDMVKPYQQTPLSFTIKMIDNIDIYKLKRLLQILLYKRGYKVDDIEDHVTNDMLTLTPYPLIYNNVDINVDNLIGYMALVDTYEGEVSVELAASDLIYACDLTQFDYINLYDLPVVTEKINANAEYNMDLLSPLVSQIYHLSFNTFSISLDELDSSLIKNFNFHILPSSLPSIIFLQHDDLGDFNKDWYNKHLNMTSTFTFHDWVFEYKPSVESMAYLKFLFHTVINIPLPDITVTPDLLVTIPVKHMNDIENIKNDINQHKIQHPYIHVLKEDEEFDSISGMIIPIYDYRVGVSHERSRLN